MVTEHPIGDTVITVPAFFNQAERRAVLRSADLAGLKVLQLINDNTAGKVVPRTPLYYYTNERKSSLHLTPVRSPIMGKR